MSPSRQQVASALLAAEPRVAVVLDFSGPPPARRPAPASTRFATLARAILHQQLAGSAAATITARATEALGGELSPATLLEASPAMLRASGVSAAKATALLDLAGRVDDGRLDLASLGRKRDEDVVAALCEVRGIGTWTAQMFLMGSLGRHDVWPTGDLGVRQGFALLTGSAVLAPRQLEDAADHCSPWRSSLAWCCWQAVDLDRRGVLPARR
jgi:DNA-3-methyladenine glycosylase II